VAARNEDIMSSFFEDYDRLTDDEAFLYFWSRCNTRCGMAGIYKCSRRTILEGRLDEGRREAALSGLSRHGIVFYEDSVVWVRERYAMLNGHGEKIALGAAADLRDIPTDHPLFVAWMQRYATDPTLGPELRRALAKKKVPVVLGDTIDALSEALSDTPSDTPSTPDSRAFSDPSPIPHPMGTGEGEGIGVVVNQVLARLGEHTGWKRPPESDRELIERLVLNTPAADHLAAATAAVAKGNDPKWRTKTPGATFDVAVKQQLEYAAPKAEAPAPDKSKYNVHLKAASDG
jgi:hypothetical protein